MASDIPTRLNPNAPPWLPQPLRPNHAPPAAVENCTPHYYHYTFIPTFNFRYFIHSPELLPPPAHPAKPAFPLRRLLRNGLKGGRRRNMVDRRRLVKGGKSGEVCGTRVQGVGETVMLRNIPNQFNRQMMLEFLDKLCYNHNIQYPRTFHCEYDFLYLPMDFRSGYNLGYAFVNFTSTAAAQWIKEMLDEYKWGVVENNHGFCFESKKICHVTRARIQGKDNLMKHFDTTLFGCSTADYLPVILSPPRDGITSFSLPTSIGRHLGSY